jgi:hypothetical protein
MKPRRKTTILFVSIFPARTEGCALSMGLAWCLYALATHHPVQDKLRLEVQAVQEETLSVEELSSLPYLDAVVRETLRLHSPVSGTGRVVKADTTIPVGKPYLDRWGNTQTTIKSVSVPINTRGRLTCRQGDERRYF